MKKGRRIKLKNSKIIKRNLGIKSNILTNAAMCKQIEIIIHQKGIPF